MDAMTKAEQPALEAWKKQLDATWRMLETMTEGARRMGEIQLEAAVAAHAGIEASRKALAGAQDPQELWRVQAEWLSRNLSETINYWQRLQQAALETQSALGGGLTAEAPSAEAGSAVAHMMDSAFRQWLQTTQQFYSAPLVAAQTRQSA